MKPYKSVQAGDASDMTRAERLATAMRIAKATYKGELPCYVTTAEGRRLLFDSVIAVIAERGNVARINMVHITEIAVQVARAMDAVNDLAREVGHEMENIAMLGLRNVVDRLEPDSGNRHALVHLAAKRHGCGVNELEDGEDA